jgi:hypothetical protein
MRMEITRLNGRISIVFLYDMVKKMKKEYVIGLCLIVLIVGIGGTFHLVSPQNEMIQTNTNNESSSVGQFQQTSGEVAGGLLSYNIVIKAEKPNAPEKITVFHTQTPVVTKYDAIALAKKFNISDFADIKEGDEKITISSQNMRKRVMLFKTGGQYYVDYDRSDTPNGIDISENFPSDEEAKKIATSFLKERDLLPDGAVVGGTEHRKAYKSNKSSGSKTVVWEDILVWYTRELNGMKIEGTQFEVEVGGHGDIIRFFSNWKEYTPVGEYPVKTWESSTETLKQKGVSTASGPDKPDTILINEIYLGYETTAVAYKEEYLEPVWVFKGEALKNGISIGPVKEFVPALTEDSKKSLSS